MACKDGDTNRFLMFISVRAEEKGLPACGAVAGNMGRGGLSGHKTGSRPVLSSSSFVLGDHPHSC